MFGGMEGSESLEQFTQEDEGCTQMEPFHEDESSSQGKNSDGGGHRPWGRLISLAGGTKRELHSRTANDGGPCNKYVLGRGKMCDIRVEDARVSSQHCRIFCDEIREAGRLVLKVYVEDTSSNGTFINGDVRLRKGQRRALNSGDEICLIKCKDKKEEEACAFVFQLLQARPIVRRVGLFSPLRQVSSLRSSPSGSLGLYGGGRRIEDYYDIRDEIGRGTSGRVHIGVNRKTGEEWAIKVIETRRFVLTPGLSPKELVQEAEVLRAIHHQSIVKLQDIFQSEEAIYLVMELVRGGDLFDRIMERGRFAEYTAREIMFRILHAVRYLHSRDIVHRDLKPENILLVHKDSDVEVKITDFGLAKRTTRDGLKTFCGTPQYFAPEVLKRRNSVLGTGRYGREADMWSLGVILYILLSGTPPFDDNTLFDQIRTASYSFGGEEWETVSEDAKDIVRKLLTTSPVTRLKADQALQHPWFTKGRESASQSSAHTVSVPSGSVEEVTHDLGEGGVPGKRDISPSSTNTVEDMDEDMKGSGFGSVPPLAVTAPVTVPEPRRRKSLHPKPLPQVSHAVAGNKRQQQAKPRSQGKPGRKRAGCSNSRKEGDVEGGGELEEDKIMDYSSSEEASGDKGPFLHGVQQQQQQQQQQGAAASACIRPSAATSSSGPSRAMFPPPPRIPAARGPRPIMKGGPIDVKINDAGTALASPIAAMQHTADAIIPLPSSVASTAAGGDRLMRVVARLDTTPPPQAESSETGRKHEHANNKKSASAVGRKRVHQGGSHQGEASGGGGGGGGKKKKGGEHQDASQRTLHQFLAFRGGGPSPAGAETL